MRLPTPIRYSTVQNSAHLCCVGRRHRCMKAVCVAEREVKLAACLTRGRRRGLFITEPLNGRRVRAGWRRRGVRGGDVWRAAAAQAPAPRPRASLHVCHPAAAAFRFTTSIETTYHRPILQNLHTLFFLICNCALSVIYFAITS